MCGRSPFPPPPPPRITISHDFFMSFSGGGTFALCPHNNFPYVRNENVLFVFHAQLIEPLYSTTRNSFGNTFFFFPAVPLFWEIVSWRWWQKREGGPSSETFFPAPAVPSIPPAGRWRQIVEAHTFTLTSIPRKYFARETGVSGETFVCFPHVGTKPQYFDPP